MALRINARFDFDSLISDGTAMLAIRTPPGVMEALPKSPRRPPPRRGSAARALTTLREVQHHCTATLAGRQEKREAFAVSRQPLSDLTVAATTSPGSVLPVQAPEKPAKKIPKKV